MIFGTGSRFSFVILILQTTWFAAYLHDLGTKSRFSFWILILQTSWFAANRMGLNPKFWDPYPPNTWVTGNLHDFGTKSIQFWDPYPANHLVYPCLYFICMILGLNLDSIFGSWSSKPAALQRVCMILGLKLDSIFGSWSFKKKDETNVYQCLQKPLIHDVKWILEILLFGSWPSKLPGFECFCMIFGTKSKFSFGILILQTTLFTVHLHDLGTKSRFSFRILILQTSWFTAYLHDLGTKSRFNFWILILQKKGWDKCLQKPLIHDAKIILEILLFGPWSSKLPSFECFCMILELSPDSALLSLSSKLPGLQQICMILGLNPGFSFWILILQTTWSWVFCKLSPDSVLGSLSSKPPVYSVFAWDF